MKPLSLIVGVLVALALSTSALAASKNTASLTSLQGQKQQQQLAYAGHQKVVRFWIKNQARKVRLLTTEPRMRKCHSLGVRAPASVCRHANAMRDLRHKMKATDAKLVAAATPQAVICAVFGSYCQQALAVSRCESGYSVYAQNGMYLGLFQMGSSERRIYGHGNDAWTQARSAYAYFTASGRDWSPWSCRSALG